MTDADIEQHRVLLQSVRGISSQAVADLIHVITTFRQNYTIPIFVEKIVSEIMKCEITEYVTSFYV